jgi:hypothetical protein
MRLRRTLIVALLSAAPMPSSEQLTAQDFVRGPKRAGLFRIGPNKWAVRGERGIVEFLPDWLTVEETPAGDGANGEDEPGFQARITDAGFDQSVFVAVGNWEAARRELDALIGTGNRCFG